MSLIITSLVYFLVFIVLTTKELITENYDHDIDQFMYFGSRILHGELIWTKEFDDKSPVLQYIFSLPAAFKSTNIFVLITLIIALTSAYMGYMMLKNMLKNFELDINKKTEKSILYFCTILYLTLLVCIYGSLHHINAISSSLCLITIALTYLNKKKKNKLIINISAITSAISISIRPYYLLSIVALPLWISIREEKFKLKQKEKKRIKAYFEYAKSQFYWILLITFYITIFNLTPYILNGNIADFMNGIKLNSIDYVNHNIFVRQYINIGRNPILYPILLGMVSLPLIRIFFGKTFIKYYRNKKKGIEKLHKVDIDIVFFGIISPMLLEIMFYRKHFFGHYFTLFTPYILISFVILLSLIARLNKTITNLIFFKVITKSIFSMLLIVCLITNQSLPKTLNELTGKKESSKSFKVQLIKEFIDQKRIKNEKIGFLAPNSNYIHWKLDESRHGFPQKAVFRNISKGKMDDLIIKYQMLDFNFLLPTKNKLCQTLIKNAPQYIITENNDYSFQCLKQRSSKYKLISSTQELNDNNIFIFKKWDE